MSRKILRLAKLLAVSIVSLVPSGETSAQAPRLTIERLYSLPILRLVVRWASPGVPLERRRA
jgi:hypothetical protein